MTVGRGGGACLEVQEGAWVGKEAAAMCDKPDRRRMVCCKQGLGGLEGSLMLSAVGGVPWPGREGKEKNLDVRHTHDV